MHVERYLLKRGVDGGIWSSHEQLGLKAEAEVEEEHRNRILRWWPHSGKLFHQWVQRIPADGSCDDRNMRHTLVLLECLPFHWVETPHNHPQHGHPSMQHDSSGIHGNGFVAVATVAGSWFPRPNVDRGLTDYDCDYGYGYGCDDYVYDVDATWKF